jgi:two-component system, NarL family, response regulator NreC
MNAPRLIIVDDSDLMRQVIERVLNSEYEVVASVADGETAITAAARHAPELVLLDISMPGINGIEAAPLIKRASPVTLIIFVSEHKEESYIDAAFSAGGSGYVVKSKMMSELLPAIDSVLAGGEYSRLTG